MAIPFCPSAIPLRLALAAMVSLLLAAPAAAGSGAAVSWTTPTPADGAKFTVKAGSVVRFSLAAATEEPGAIVHIAPTRSLPPGVKFSSSDGVTARATFAWTPEAGGDYTLSFAARLVGATAVAPTVTYAVHVQGPTARRYPVSSVLTDDKVARWAPVVRKAVVRTQPRASARALTTLTTRTTDSETQNLVLMLSSVRSSATETWYRVRLPMLPNNSVGWVPARYLGDVYKVNTHLYVDRARFRATLKRNGKVVFTSIVGVGRSIWPTPRGEFYIRSKLTNYDDPFYGPVAFGTSARSSTLTDWPGGGFVGVHGTNQPGILPGRVSHGCIRLPNASILRLARLMPVGTPLTIT